MVKPVDASPNAVWKQRYRAPSIYYAGIAPLAPDRGLVWTNLSGTVQFHAWDVPSGTLKQLTNTPGGHNTFLDLSPDGQWLYYLMDNQGNEIGHYVRMPYSGGNPEDITPDFPPYASFGLNQNRACNRLGFTSADASGFTVYLIDIDPHHHLSSPRPLYHMSTIGFGPMFSADGNLAVVMSSERSGKNEFSLLAFDVETGKKIGELWDGDGTSLSFNLFSPVKSDSRLLATTNRSGLERVLIWNPLTNQRNDLDLEYEGAHHAQDWSRDGERILIGAMDQAVESILIHQPSTNKTRKLNTPPGNFGMFFTPDDRHIYAIWEDASHNPRVVEINEKDGAISQTILAPGNAPTGRSMTSVSFPSTDGKLIQGWLCAPDGRGPFPTILETHGGPTAVQTNNFNSGAQAWIDHGFAYLTINYHGSVTFGREFEQSIWNDVGHWEVEDLASAHRFLVDQGIARPDAIFLTGWSYGGYLTLLGLGKRPDLWAGGMAGIAIADWAMQWEDGADTLRGYMEALFGGTPKDQPERYKVSSPITYAESVLAPIMIIQGRNDTRTPARPVQVYEQKLRDLGKNIHVHWFDTGHMGAFTNTEQSIQHQEMMMRFAEAILDKGALPQE